MGGTRALISILAVAILVGACGTDLPRPSGASSAEASSPPPEPQTGYRQPQEVFLALLADCVRAAGFEALIQENGGILTPGRLTTAERAALDTAYKDCTLRIDPRRAEPPPELTDAQWGASYRYLLAEVACLRDLGHAVPPPPDFEAWRESNRAWDPYHELIRQDRPAPNYHVLTCQNVPERPAFLDQ
ncbi:MAG: hypothetical protein FIA92_02440 [Chloroflexi bacterium]|nr:hypothetical protein [Chloroflexota bacterium]